MTGFHGESGAEWKLAHGVVGPTERSYWVVDGRLAAGAYPGKAGRGSLEQVPEVLEKLLEAGIDTFVNLTQDDSAVFPHGTDVHLTRYLPAVADRAEVLACPIPDMGLPDGGPDEMKEILDAVDLALDSGRNVYVHCWGGSGRTGMVVGCWLRRHGLAEPEEVLEVLQDLRTSGDRNGGHKDTPQTPDQRWMVESWEEGR